MSEPQPWIDDLLEAWRTNNRINLFLIDHISDEGMKCTLSKRGGRNVVRQFLPAAKRIPTICGMRRERIGSSVPTTRISYG